MAGLVLAGCGGEAPTAPGGSTVDPADATFDIQIRFWPGTSLSEAQRSRIEAAAIRWEQVLQTGLPETAVKGTIGCGPASPAIDETVDDLVIWVRVVDIPALAESGPCVLRSGSLLPATGTVWLDGPSRVNQLAPEFLEALVTHEIGHVLGFGTLWDRLGLLRDPALAGGTDPYFAGAAALAAFDAIGGAGYTGAKVPVENAGGPGTADGHWRASVFGEQELMSFTILRRRNPLSLATAAAMADLGYDVDMTAADAYQIPNASVAPRGREAARAERIEERLAPWPLIVVDPSGRRIERSRPR